MHHQVFIYLIIAQSELSATLIYNTIIMLNYEYD